MTFHRRAGKLSFTRTKMMTTVWRHRLLDNPDARVVTRKQFLTLLVLFHCMPYLSSFACLCNVVTSKVCAAGKLFVIFASFHPLRRIYMLLVRVFVQHAFSSIPTIHRASCITPGIIIPVTAAPAGISLCSCISLPSFADCEGMFWGCYVC
jgi:hypothetical protein